MDREALTELFHKLGAKNPEMWANSHIDEGFPQIARFIFLKKAWSLVVSDVDLGWMEEMLKFDTGGPGGEIVHALKTLISSGADKQIVSDVVRVMQWKLLHSLCYMLDDPGGDISGVDDISWRLFQVDEKGRPIAAMSGLHESVLELEPSGTEMTPRGL